MTTAKLLKIFRDCDILKESKKGDLKLYSINMENPIVRQLKIFVNITDIYPSIKELKDKGTEVFLFGSAARGEDTEESDIDLLIITGFDRSSIMKVIDTIRMNTNREVNPIIYTPIEYSQLALTNQLFYEKFEKDKIRLL
jgi:predicted nucleotidyltransferase